MLAVAANVATTGTEGQITACLSRELYGARDSFLHIHIDKTRAHASELFIIPNRYILFPHSGNTLRSHMNHFVITAVVILSG